MEPFFDFVGHFWWLIFPLSGLFGGWARSWSKASERRHRRRVELYKLRNQAAEAEQASRTRCGSSWTATTPSTGAGSTTSLTWGNSSTSRS